MESDLPDSEASRAAAIVSELGVSENVRLAEALVSEALGLITDQPDTLDLKMATAALAEMRDAYAVFTPFRGNGRCRSSDRRARSPTIRSTT